MRDYFAAKAMQGLMSREGKPDVEHETALAYRIADAMLKAREGGSRPECEAAAAEIERLRAERADLLDALLVAEGSVGDSHALKVVRAAIAKLEGGAA